MALEKVYKRRHALAAPNSRRIQVTAVGRQMTVTTTRRLLLQLLNYRIKFTIDLDYGPYHLHAGPGQKVK
jgi:hypothetical protein